MNIQFVIVGGAAYRSPGVAQNDAAATSVYVLEVNPRGSRTIPFISKVTGLPVASIATRVMLGQTLTDQGYEDGLWPTQDLVGVKAPVFSMAKLIGVDWHLGPEMKSTGEVMGIDHDFTSALTKALLAANLNLKHGMGVLLSIADQHKSEAMALIQGLNRASCKLYATEGTAAMIAAMGIPVIMTTKKLGEGHPNVVDVINDRSVDAVVNTISGVSEVMRDGFNIRRAAVERQIPCFTSLDTARAAVESLLAEQANYAVGTTSEYLNKE